MLKGAALYHTVLGLVPALKMAALGQGMREPSRAPD